MTRLLDKYNFDLTDVRRLEILYGEPLPDLLEPLRLVDADVEAIRAQLDEYVALAEELQVAHQELTRAKESQAWEGTASEAASGFWDVVLTVLKWIAAVILFIVAALLIVLAFLLIVVAELCRLVGDVLSWVAGAIAVLVVVIVAVRSGGGRANSGRAVMIWEALKIVFNTARVAAAGIVEAVADGFGGAVEIVGRGVMWLGLYLIEVGADLVDQPSDKVEAERDKLF